MLTFEGAFILRVDNQTDEQDCYLDVIQTLFRGLNSSRIIFTIPHKECIIRVIP